MPARAALLAAMLLIGAAAHAQSPLPGDGLRLDMVRGPLITSSRIMGLGGAFVGVAEGIDGIHRNPAALSNRTNRSTSFFDLDVTFDWLFVSSAEVDWDGDGRALSEDLEFQAVNLGLTFQLGPFGLGALVTFYGWEAVDFEVAHVDVLLGAGWAFDDGAWIVGAGLGVATLAVATGPAQPPEGRATAELSGNHGDFGVLWRPRGESWRLGARVRTEARLRNPTAALFDTGLVPWQVALGWSSYHPAEPGRRYNPRLRAKVPPPKDRRYLLVSAELELLGPSDGVSLESLILANPRPSGRNVALAIHLGAEGEVIHDRLRSRIGTYWEPVRVVGNQDLRPHLTGGFEIHLFELLFDWKANFAFDLAPGWQNVTLGVGFWK